MSLYIKGVSLPKRCMECQFLEGDDMDGLCHAANRWLDDEDFWTWYAYSEGDIDTSKPCNCPLIDVPEHGRLGDLDVLTDVIEHVTWYHQNEEKEMVEGANTEEHQAWYKEQDIYAAIEDAETIIPANKEDTP